MSSTDTTQQPEVPSVRKMVTPALVALGILGIFAAVNHKDATPVHAPLQPGATPRIGVDEMSTRTLQNALSKVAQGSPYANVRLASL